MIRTINRFTVIAAAVSLCTLAAFMYQHGISVLLDTNFYLGMVLLIANTTSIASIYYRTKERGMLGVCSLISSTGYLLGIALFVISQNESSLRIDRLCIVTMITATVAATLRGAIQLELLVQYRQKAKNWWG